MKRAFALLAVIFPLASGAAPIGSDPQELERALSVATRYLESTQRTLEPNTSIKVAPTNCPTKFQRANAACHKLSYSTPPPPRSLDSAVYLELVVDPNTGEVEETR